jgi:hypothetical protein
MFSLIVTVPAGLDPPAWPSISTDTTVQVPFTCGVPAVAAGAPGRAPGLVPGACGGGT